VRPDKILLVAHSFLPDGVGGTEVYTYRLAKALSERGHRVTIVAALDSPTKSRYSVIRTRFEGLNVLRIVNSASYAESFEDYFIDSNIDSVFQDILTQQAPDVIHIQHTANLSGRLPEIAHEMRIPTVFTLHDYWYLCFRSHLLRPGVGICAGPSGGTHCASCEDPLLPNPTAVPKSSALLRWVRISGPYIPRALIKKLPQEFISGMFRSLYEQPAIGPDRIREHRFRYSFFKRQLSFPQFLLSPSQHLKTRYADEGFANIQVLPLGFLKIHSPKREPPGQKLRIIFIGMIERDKGVTVLLKELLQFDRLETLAIHIHGRSKDTIYMNEVHKLAGEYPEGTVTLHGAYRSDKELTAILSTAHVVVFPSLWEENYPLVVREALLHGVPVIGSKYGGVAEVIKNRVNGLLFDPYKNGDLLEKIRLIVRKPELLDQLNYGATTTSIENMDDHIAKLCRLYADARRMPVPI
jgi:glycosyltransferase involved in cell wall biosynthesis